MDGSRSTSSTRLYGAAIAFASGGYSVLVGSTGRTAGAWLMLLLGVVVVLHGAVLLSSWADRLGDASGPLMIGYAVLMLANQLWMVAMPGGAMDGGMMDGGGMGGGMMDGGMMGMGWDAGMVTLALLMLASGAIMTVRSDGM